MFRSLSRKLGHPLAQTVREVQAIAGRERTYLRGEFAQFRGVIPLLARSGSRQPLSHAERAALHAHLRRAASLSPYLAVTLLPGAFVLLPMLLWWRDRRRNRDSRVLACSAGKIAS